VNVLAVIPARAGSVGVPHKNIRQCGGRPLMAWSIGAALASRHVTRVVVSSDSEAYLSIARSYGAETVLRPPELSDGTHGKMDYAVRHALKAQAEEPDLVVTLQPTVPDRRPGLIDECISRLLETEADSLFTAEALPYVWWRRPNTGQWAHEVVWETNNPAQVTRQELAGHDYRWKQDGAVYVSRPWLLLDEPGHRRPPRKLGGRIQVYPNEWTIDIDTEAQFLAADAMLAARAAERTVA
jgi:CMP-N,N'-diacetyllegionaminic acid synthase